VNSDKKKKIVKTIKIDADKCNGCRKCEVICSSFHATPKYSSNNPARSRIRVNRHPLKGIFIPVIAGEYTATECMVKSSYIIDGKEYSECTFCRAPCPSKEEFRDPDSGLPLKCDICEGEDEPLCVKYCVVDALTYEEKEEETGEEEDEKEDIDMGLITLVDKYGMDKVMDAVVRMSESKKAPFPS
jgi:benzoyl-CoA reductase subunit BamC